MADADLGAELDAVLDAGGADDNAGGGNAAGVTLLRGRFAIHSATPLPDLDSPTAKAFYATDKRDSSGHVFALICSPAMPQRTETMVEIKGFETVGLLTMVEWGTVWWPPANANMTAVIYERPLGGRVTTALAQGKLRISEYELPRRIIEPAAAALATLETLGVQHRAVRPDNLFFLDEKYQRVVLGECVTSPPGYDQPIVCETIERGMCSQGGRGYGNSAADVYALGATLIILLLGHNPLQRMTSDEMLEVKVEQGSFATLCGATRVPMSLLEPLKGMLSDEAYERWDYTNIKSWIDGKKSTPIQRRAAVRADTPYTFEGLEISTPRMMAHFFARNPAAAAKAVRSDPHLESFCRRGLNNPNLAERLSILADQNKTYERSPLGTDDMLTAKVCMVLDPAGPIRYKGVAFMGDGFGTLLATEYTAKGAQQAHAAAEAVMRDLHDAWYAVQPRGESDLLQAHKAMSRCKAHLKIRDPGHGLERCLYDMNPGLMCQSPLVIELNVAEPEDLLDALDKIAGDTGAQTRPMDRHIAAFIAARYADDIHAHLKALAAPGRSESALGMLSFYAFLQWKLRRNEPLLSLAGWIGGLLGPAVETYHSRTARKELERQMPGAVRKGSLSEMYSLIENTERRRMDAEGFAQAQREWAEAEKEVREIEGEEGDRMVSSTNKGRQLAAASAVMASTGVVCAILLLGLL